MRKSEWEKVFEPFLYGITKVKFCKNIDCEENYEFKCACRWINIDEQRKCADFRPKIKKEI